MQTPFFTAEDHLGHHDYFRSQADADAWRDAHGGFVIETTPHRIWRVTTPTTGA